MASFFKRKNKTDEVTPGASMPDAGTRAARNGRSEKPKKVKAPKQPKPPKAPKPPRKPLFGRKKKVAAAAAGQDSGRQANVPLEGPAQNTHVVPEGLSGGAGMGSAMPGAPGEGGKPARKSLFGRKKKDVQGAAAVKPPRQKKIKAPKAAKPPKQKKIREPKPPKAPRGRRRGHKGAPEPLPGTVAIPGQMPLAGSIMPGAIVPPKKGRFGKKPKAPKPPKRLGPKRSPVRRRPPREGWAQARPARSVSTSVIRRLLPCSSNTRSAAPLCWPRPWTTCPKGSCWRARSGT